MPFSFTWRCCCGKARNVGSSSSSRLLSGSKYQNSSGCMVIVLAVAPSGIGACIIFLYVHIMYIQIYIRYMCRHYLHRRRTPG